MNIKQIIGLIILRLLSTVIALVVLAGLLYRRWRNGKDYFAVKPRPTPPSLISDEKWGTHKYMHLKKQGIRLHYVEKGNSNNPLILCLHGFPECWFSWRHQLENLSDKYWVVAVDMRGYADSDKPSAKSAYDITLLVEDIKEFILALGKSDQDKCVVMAHDWGGAIAWQLVMKYPELFHSHISCNGPHPVAFMKVMRKSWKQALMSWYMVFFQTPYIPELSISVNDLEMFNKSFRGEHNKEAFPDDVMEVYKYYFSQKGALTPPINYYRNIDFGRGTENIPVVTVPTLIIWGSKDAYLSKEMAILAGAECETSVVKYIDSATHWVQQDEPQQVNRFIREYLASKSL
ncbi:epoxide hydrolase 1-like isoform X3 [Palaemon carinicauda]|uniref:epoxide hydrolase 1-like isoform X2 n=1 Tax=Palaemon carinicauda TaxID=392227 RepID=UPI0035B62667